MTMKVFTVKKEWNDGNTKWWWVIRDVSNTHHTLCTCFDNELEIERWIKIQREHYGPKNILVEIEQDEINRISPINETKLITDANERRKNNDTFTR